MSLKEGTLRARLSIAVAILMGAVLAIAVLALLWRSSAAAHASTLVERNAASAELAKARSDLASVEDELTSTQSELTTVNGLLLGWQHKFDVRTRQQVAHDVRLAKTDWIDRGYKRGHRAGYKQGRSAGYRNGKSAGYDDGYSDGAAQSASSARGSGGGGGMGGAAAHDRR